MRILVTGLGVVSLFTGVYLVMAGDLMGLLLAVTGLCLRWRGSIWWPENE